MPLTVLKAFPFSRDGIRIETALPGPAPDIPADLVPGLKQAGYLDDDDGPGEIAIPDDWRDLHHMKLIALAKQIDPDVSSKDEAVAAIEARLAGAQG